MSPVSEREASATGLSRVIEVGVDGTTAGDAALGWALDEAVVRQDSVEALSVWPYPPIGVDGLSPPEPVDEPLVASMRADVHDALGRVGYRGEVPVRIVTHFGLPGWKLEQESEATGAELLVIGRSTHRTMSELFFGSVAGVLLSASSRAVAVVPDSFHRGHTAGLIVVGIDGSPRGRSALTWALAEGRARRAKVRAVLAWTPARRTPRRGNSVPCRPGKEEPASVLAARLADAELSAVTGAALSPEGAEVTAVACQGDAAEILLHQAAEADLLVLGDHPRPLLGEIVFGSTTRRCLRESAAPVVVVPRAGQR